MTDIDFPIDERLLALAYFLKSKDDTLQLAVSLDNEYLFIFEEDRVEPMAIKIAVEEGGGTWFEMLYNPNTEDLAARVDAYLEELKGA